MEPKQNPNPQKAVPKKDNQPPLDGEAPEPEFNDSVKTAKGKIKKLKELAEEKKLAEMAPWLRWLCKNRNLLLVVAVVFAGLIGFIFFSRGPENKNVPVMEGGTERRNVVTPESVDQQIDAAGKIGAKSVVVKNKESVPSKKRNYASGIAVYIYKEEKDRPSPETRDLHSKAAALGLPSGTKIPALLSNRIFSFNVEAPVLATLSKDFLWQDRTLIPKGSRFLGKAATLKSLDRINVHFDLLIFPDGREMRIRALALSEDGSAGVKGKVEKHRDVKTLKALAESVIGMGSLFFGRTSDPYSLESQLRYNVASNFTNQAEQELRNVPTDVSIIVEAYTPVQIILLEAI